MKSTDQHSTTTSHQSRQAQSAKSHFFDPESDQGFFSQEGATLDRPSFFSGSAGANADNESPFLQAKSNATSTRLRLGRPNDHYEQEADTTADRVVKGIANENATHTAATAASDSIQAKANGLQRKPIFESDAEPNVQAKSHKPVTPVLHSILQRQVEEGQEEEISTKEDESLQRKPIFESAGDPEDSGIQRKATQSEGAGTVSPNFEQRLNSTKGGGQSMPDGVRSGMEEQFGADFSGVRVHTGQEASKLNQEVGAKAFTHGNDIYFDEGNYQPDNPSGQHLLAHELTHTVQQGASVQRKPAISNTPDQIQGGWLSDGIEWVKGKIADGLNWAAEKLIPGYSLLNVILGKNMITGKPVQRTGANIIKGYMQLIPVIGTILLNELKETDSLTQASSWVEGQVAKFGIDFDDIARRINLMWEAVSVWNSMETNVRIFQKYIGPVLGKFLAFSSVVEQKCKELRLEGALRLVGAHELLASLKKSPEAMKRVIDKPSLIFEYFIKALKQGFQNFKDNFGKHFKAALFGWLFGKAAEMGIQMPQKFNIVGLFHLIAQIVGATYTFIRTQAVKALGPKGEKIISTLEQTAGVVFDLVTQGPKALWELVKEKLANLKEMLFSQITSLVTGEIIKAAVLKLVSMLNPAGAIVQLALTIYKVIKYFIDWWDTIKQIATGILGAITKVALGSIAGAATFIEGLFGKGMKLIIAFLARIFGLGGIAQKVKKLIKKIAGPVQKAIGKVVKFIVAKGKKLLGKLLGKGKASKGDAKGVKYTQQDKDKGLKAFEQEEKAYVKDNSISQDNAKMVASKVQKKHPVFKSIKVIDGGKDWDYEYVFRVSKHHSTKSEKIEKGDLVGLVKALEKKFGSKNVISAKKLRGEVGKLAGIKERTISTRIKELQGAELIYHNGGNADKSFYAFKAEVLEKESKRDRDALYELYKKAYNAAVIDSPMMKKKDWVKLDDKNKDERIGEYRQNFRKEVIEEYTELDALNKHVLKNSNMPSIPKLTGVIFEEWLIAREISIKPNPWFTKTKNSKNPSDNLYKSRQADGYRGSKLIEAKGFKTDRKPINQDDDAKDDDIKKMADYNLIISEKIPWYRSKKKGGNPKIFDFVEYHFNSEELLNLWLDDLRDNIAGSFVAKVPTKGVSKK